MSDFDKKLLSLIHNSKDPQKAFELRVEFISKFLKENAA